MKIEYEVKIGQAKTSRGACVRPLVSTAPHSSNGGIGVGVTFVGWRIGTDATG